MEGKKRDRAQCLVCRGDQILMIEHRMRGRDFYNLPGGGVEDGETPEEAALRELKEEVLVDGKVLRPLAREYKPDGVSRVFTFLVEIPDDATPGKGKDPELSDEEQTIVGFAWKKLHEIAERDRAYLFGAGLMRVPLFHDEVLTWGDEEYSYPGDSEQESE